MNFDLNDTYNTTQVAIHAMYGSQAAGTAASPATQPSARCKLTGIGPQGGAKFGDLPPEIRRLIADWLPPDDIPNFATVDRRTLSALRERRLQQICCDRIRRCTVANLAVVQQRLDEIDGIDAEPSLRHAPLTALSNRLNEVPVSQRPEAFKRLFNAANRIPSTGLSIQKAMLLSLANFPPRQRAELFEFAYATAGQRPRGEPNGWAELAVALGYLHLPPPQMAAHYLALLGRLPSLDAKDQAELLSALSAHLPIFNAEDVLNSTSASDQYSVLAEQTMRLPSAYQGLPLGSLAVALWELPKSERAAHYAQIKQRSLMLPEEQLGLAVGSLPIGLASLPPHWHAQELDRLEPVFARVAPAHRATVAIGLMECASLVNHALTGQVWQRALHMLDGMTEHDFLSVVFRAYDSGVFDMVIEDDWHYVRDGITAFVKRNHYGEPTRTLIATMFNA